MIWSLFPLFYNFLFNTSKSSTISGSINLSHCNTSLTRFWASTFFKSYDFSPSLIWFYMLIISSLSLCSSLIFKDSWTWISLACLSLSASSATNYIAYSNFSFASANLASETPLVFILSNSSAFGFEILLSSNLWLKSFYNAWMSLLSFSL